MRANSILAALLVLVTSAISYGAFDVSVHFNGGSDVVYIGEDNILEIYIENSEIIHSMSLGLEFTNSVGGFELVSPYGTRPVPPLNQYIMEHGNSIGSFGSGSGLLANLLSLSDSILFGGVTSVPDTATGLAAHPVSTLCFTMKIRIPAGLPETLSGFCVDNIFFPPAGNWVMVYRAGPGQFPDVVPTFQGQPNTSQLVPDAPAVCFDLVQRPPCNPPLITNCAGVPTKGTIGSPVTFDFNATNPEPGNLSWSVIANNPVVNPPTIDANGNFSFLFDITESATFKNFTVIATNDCGGADSCQFAIENIPITPFVIRIEKTHNTLQGGYEYVSITKESGSDQIGGFDFLVAYDASALSFQSASLGAAAGPAGCGWEYFTYRYGPFGNCGGPCPSGMLRVIALADANNGANHPDCFGVPDGGELVSLKFFVTDDRTFECQYIPIRFAWIDCGDNGISNVGGDTLWISSKVFDFENTNPLIDPNYEITDMSCYFAIAYGGACADCDVSQKYEPIRYIYFWNGGIDIVCADSIDARGDLNLNGVPNEIADAVLFTNYFLYGLSALESNPQFRQAQIAASDVNADGHTLTVGDLVYLMRIIVGDALPFPKLAPFANTATVTFDGTLSTNSSVEIGAIYVTFKTQGSHSINHSGSMELATSESDGLLKVLVYSGLDDLTNRLPAGANSVFSITGAAELVDVQIADYDGNLLNARVEKSTLPTEFRLAQNVPNPFNPTTRISLFLPVQSDWQLDIINVAGQLVREFSGRGIGEVVVEWDARSMPSGVYFYRATSGAFADTRKMLLLK